MKKAVYTLARLALRNVDQLAPQDKVDLYDSLALLMPTRKERDAAERIAWMLKEALMLQTSFLGDLFPRDKDSL